MTAAVLLHLLTYAALATFVLVVVVRFAIIYKMPMHVRWELYPVAHEAGKRAEYGGSMLEEIDWWTKPKERSTVNELKVMIPEMTLLKALFEHNRSLWWWSFPFHFGLYMLIGTIALLLLGAVLGIAGVSETSILNPSTGSILNLLTRIVGFAGLSLATIGSIGLLGRRLFDSGLRDYTSGAAIFNLVFFVAVFGVTWLTFLFADPTFEGTRAYVQSLLIFDLHAPVGSTLLGLDILLAVVLIAYIPMTHMSHFFIKWFTYHRIRWDDEPNLGSGSIEKKIFKQVQHPVTWAAPPISTPMAKRTGSI